MVDINMIAMLKLKGTDPTWVVNRKACVDPGISAGGSSDSFSSSKSSLHLARVKD